MTQHLHPGRARAILRSPFSQLARRAVDGLLDRARLRLDRLGLQGYQPMPMADTGGHRALGTRSRWERISPLIAELQIATALDVGCNSGWFTYQLASAGVATIGVESDPPMTRTAIYVARRARPLPMGILYLHVDASTVKLLPETDCVLFLSVWHHMVRDYGLAAADAILAALWGKTRKVLLFDTGESECIDEFRLPAMVPTPRAWLDAHLGEVCQSAEVRNMGRHAAFAPDGTPCTRELLALMRT
jgi:SAM-dependent methyltransferase